MISQVPRVSPLGLGCQDAVGEAVELSRENRKDASGMRVEVQFKLQSQAMQ